MKRLLRVLTIMSFSLCGTLIASCDKEETQDEVEIKTTKRSLSCSL